MSALKECNFLWLREPETKYKDCELYLSNMIGGFAIRHKGDEGLMYLKARAVDCVILALGDKNIADAAFLAQEAKKLDPDLPIALCTNELPEQIQEIIPVPIDFITTLPLKLATLKQIVSNLETKIIHHNAHAAPPNSQPMGVEESITSYFQTEQDYLASMERKGKVRKMDFQKMKRFILTAYNNFLELDVRLREDRDLIKSHDALFHALHLQKILKHNVAAGIDYQYEKIYLMQHPRYLSVVDKLEQISLKISIFQQEITNITSQMEEIKERIRYIPSVEARIELQKKYKELNSLSTDHVHNISKLKEEFERFTKEKAEIYQSEFKAFSFAFKRISEHYLEQYEDLVDRLAYMFDRTLWIAARASRVIIDFFEQGKIAGAFSSKAYMEYFLRSIDHELTKDHNKELLDYRTAMEEQNSIQIALIGSNTEHIKYESRLLESIDSYVKSSYFSSNQLQDFWNNAEKYDLIFFEDAIGRIIFYQFYKEIVQFFKNKQKLVPECYLICRYGKNHQKSAKLAVSLGIKGSFTPPLEEEEIKELLLELLT